MASDDSALPLHRDAVPAWLRPQGTHARRKPGSRPVRRFFFALAALVVVLYTWDVLTSDEKSSIASTYTVKHASQTHHAWLPFTKAKAKPNVAVPHVKQSYGQVEPIQMFRPFDLAGSTCREQWIANGTLCSNLDFSAYRRIDGLYSWVNGSDARHGRERNATIERLSQDAEWVAQNKGVIASINDEGRFREHNELLYAIRSAFKHLGSSLGSVHLLTTDFLLPQSSYADVTRVPGAASINEEKHGRLNHLLDTLGLNAASLAQSGASIVEPASVVKSGEQLADVFSDEWGRLREGQVPQWLNLSSAAVASGDQVLNVPDSNVNGAPSIRVHHHWNSICDSTYRPSTHAEARDSVADLFNASAVSDERIKKFACRTAALPTFNANAVESMIGDQAGLSETFFYGNDDYFFGQDATAGDFFSPLYGPIFRIENEGVSPEFYPINDGGEWPSLHHSNALISARFGQRNRLYAVHQHRTFMLPVYHEAKQVWGEQWERGQMHKFRAQQDVHSAFMSMHYQIQRHREALLWSYLIGRMDVDGDGYYSPSEWQSLISELGFPLGAAKPTLITVRHPKRNTLAHDAYNTSLVQTGFTAPKGTLVGFVSADGYPWVNFEQRNNIHGPLPEYTPDRWQAGENQKACFVEPVCLEPFFEAAAKGEKINAQQLFTRVAFEHWGCGDCMALGRVTASGTTGLSAFLPHAEQRMPGEAQPDGDDTLEPHLPLVAEFQRGDFSLADVAQTTHWSGKSRRSFAVKLIQRYQYALSISIGAAGIQEIMDAASTDKALGMLRKEAPTLYCINDDIYQDEEIIKHKLHDYFEEKYPTRLPFEL